MTSLGPLTYRRARASGSSPVPVDESLGLVDAAVLSSAALGAGSGGVLCEDRRHDAVGEHPAAPDSDHKRALGDPGPETPTASVTPRAYRTGGQRLGVVDRAWCRSRTAVPRPPGARPPAAPRRQGRDPRSGRMPESGKVTLKAQLAGRHIELRPDVRIGRRRRRDNWRAVSTEVIDFWAGERHPTMRWPPTGSRGARFCVTTPVASAR